MTVYVSVFYVFNSFFNLSISIFYILTVDSNPLNSSIVIANSLLVLFTTLKLFLVVSSYS